MEHYYNAMKKYPWIHTVVLFLILLSGAVLFYYGIGNQTMQIVSGIVTTILYVAWGIVHHALVGDLHRKIVIEYLLIGAIAIVLLATLAV